MGHTTPLQKLPLSLEDLHPRLYIVPWAHRLGPPNGISIGSAVFAGLTNVTNRQTHGPRHSVCSSRLLSLAIGAIRPNNNIDTAPWGPKIQKCWWHVRRIQDLHVDKTSTSVLQDRNEIYNEVENERTYRDGYTKSIGLR